MRSIEEFPRQAVAPRRESFQFSLDDQLAQIPMERGLGLKEFLQPLLRYKLLFFAIVSVIVVVAAGVLWAMPSKYAAEARILVEDENAGLADVFDLREQRASQIEIALEQKEILHSREVAERVIGRLDLDQDPEINPTLGADSELADLTATLAGLWDEAATEGLELWHRFVPVASGDTTTMPAARGDEPGAPDEAMVAALEEEAAAGRLPVSRIPLLQSFLSKLHVAQTDAARILSVSFWSLDPEKAALIANTVAEEYVAFRRENRVEVARRATVMLEDNIANLRQQVETGEEQLEDLRARSTTLARGDTSIISGQLANANARVVELQALRAEAEARLDQLQTLSEEAPERVLNILDSPLLQRLRQDEALLLQDLSRMSSELGERHPRIVSARSELADVRSNIRRQIDQLLRGREHELAIAARNEALMRERVETLEAQLGQANREEAKLRTLERKVEADRELLGLFLSRLTRESATAAGTLRGSSEQIISRAYVPVDPVSPNKRMILALAFLGACGTGILTVYGAARMSPTLHGREEVERTLGARALATLPKRFGARAAARSGPPAGRSGEAIRRAMKSLYIQLVIARHHVVPRSVMVTGAEDDEDTTSLVLSLAHARSLAGQKVAVIDANLHRPELHRRLGIRMGPGLADLIVDRAVIDDVLVTVPAWKVDVIPAGATDTSGHDLMLRTHFRRLLRLLLNRYDLVLIDGASLAEQPDGALLAPEVDATVMIVRSGKTDRKAAWESMEQLHLSGADVAGLVVYGSR